MTVKELIIRLQEYPPDVLVYVPCTDGRCDPVHTVCVLKHLNLPAGIAIPDDIVLLPGSDLEHGVE